MDTQRIQRQAQRSEANRRVSPFARLVSKAHLSKERARVALHNRIRAALILGAGLLDLQDLPAALRALVALLLRAPARRPAAPAVTHGRRLAALTLTPRIIGQRPFARPHARACFAF